LEGLRASLGSLAFLAGLRLASCEGEFEFVELAGILLDAEGSELSTLEVLVRPGSQISNASLARAGLCAMRLCDAMPLVEALDVFRKEIAGYRPVVFDVPSQRTWLDALWLEERSKGEWLDAQELFALAYPEAPDLRFETLLHIPDEEGHFRAHGQRRGALTHALALARAVAKLGLDAAEGDPRCRLVAHALGRYWPTSDWRALLGRASGLAPSFSWPDFVSIESSEETPVPFEEEAIAAVLRDEARGRRHFPNYRVREEQVELARHFVRSLAEGKTALLEGGTGVGKSLAYLAAAIPFAVSESKANRRSPVLISTRTKLLQDQLIDKDIAAAARFLGIPELLATSIKGRANYLCARRFEAVMAEGGQSTILPEDRLAYAILATAAELRAHAEVGSLPRDFHQRFPLLGKLLREAVSRRADQCPRESCAHAPHCALGARRKALAKAHLLVVNHDLLLRWPVDYPPFTNVVVDEVHELCGVADEVFAAEFRPDEVLARFDEVFGGKKGEGMLSPAVARAFAKRVSLWRGELREELRWLGKALSVFSNEFGCVEFPPEPPSAFDPIADGMERAAQRLTALANEFEDLRESEGDNDRAIGPLRRAEEDFRSAASVLRLVFGSLEESVSRVEGLVSPFDHWKLVVRPVSPADRFHEGFLERLDSFAGVSASLFIDGSSLASLGELEIEARAQGNGLLRAAVPSPFPYAQRMRALALRTRGQLVEETAEVLTLLATRLGGRTLGLFTSLRRMDDVAARIGPELRRIGIELLVPRSAGDDPAALVERFREEPRAVLLGARTFWQGLDLPGEDVQAVVIEKLPFEVPTELHRRREARLRSLGINAFGHYTVGKMLLSLRQMVGRLIRTEEDRGIVVIVESRHDRGYYDRLSRAMPPGVELCLGELEDLERLLAEVGVFGNPSEGGKSDEAFT